MSADTSTYPDDILSGDFTPEDQKHRRLDEITTWFSRFAEYCLEEGGIGIGFKAGIQSLINSAYWEQMDEVVRPKIISGTPNGEARADRHKIASLMELMIVHAQPVTYGNPEIAEDLNVRLAFYVATNIIGNWNSEKCENLYVSESFDREHRTWLRRVNTKAEGMPVFSNAATWYLVELLYLERVAKAQA
ncbi:MAG: hypothetical protein Q8O25_12115 [Sulfurisoma sp.]|nr:hypothetical protein [Sulfurisoma sp.]